MWFSWRDKKSIALVESDDGIHWGQPQICLKNKFPFSWESSVNRPIVIKKPDGYHMWYTGQSRAFFFKPAQSFIGYAVSPDGENWRRVSSDPVLKPDQEWEKVAVMCPDVIWDEKVGIYKMWYSGGNQGEPDAIGYAESADGQKWVKRPNPVFAPSRVPAWDSEKVTACQVLKQGSGYWMFYIGFSGFRNAQIGLARSPDGISRWQRYPGNPILSPTPGQWDGDAVYKPFALLDGSRWMLWYNGRRSPLEQIGLAFHPKRIPGWN
ncbi:MAG TPA: hypothetical protein VK859_17605 [bacterium]|nr:hypothetical protein [bacterium]